MIRYLCRALAPLLFVWATGASAAEPAAPAPAAALSILSVTVEPAAPAADTLCRLRVQIRNAGARPASHLVFRVRIGPHELPVYGKLVYLQALPAGASSEVRLYNFWTSETGRPFPADGKLAVEVTLLEARWVRVETVDGAEVTTPLEPVAGLPVSRSITLTAPPAKYNSSPADSGVHSGVGGGAALAPAAPLPEGHRRIGRQRLEQEGHGTQSRVTRSP